MSILGKHSVDDFLSKFWQQKPLLIRGATSAYNDVLTPDELAGLACEEEIESRLIQRLGEDDWTMEHGPLDEGRFAELPEEDWTLLVQSVDHWLPEVGLVLKDFNFLPNWRLDDVMISYAATGGSVGPHFDYYDVFLLQTSGRRKWRLGQQCDQESALIEGQPLKLLSEFKQTAEHDLEPGDMLYIPAGVAHWGLGLDDECMTWSIGFRAPSATELLSTAVQTLCDQLPEDLRFKDSQNSLKAPSGEISNEVTKQLESMATLMTPDLLSSAMVNALGKLNTEPRYPEHHEYEEWQESEVDELFEQQAILVRNHRCRVAFHVHPDDVAVSSLYVNGEQIEIPTEFAELICAEKAELASFESGLGRDLLRVLLFAGVYIVQA